MILKNTLWSLYNNAKIFNVTETLLLHSTVKEQATISPVPWGGKVGAEF